MKMDLLEWLKELPRCLGFLTHAFGVPIFAPNTIRGCDAHKQASSWQSDIDLPTERNCMTVTFYSEIQKHISWKRHSAKPWASWTRPVLYHASKSIPKVCIHTKSAYQSHVMSHIGEDQSCRPRWVQCDKNGKKMAMTVEAHLERLSVRYSVAQTSAAAKVTQIAPIPTTAVPAIVFEGTCL